MTKTIKRVVAFSLALLMMLTSAPMNSHAEQTKSLDNFKKVQEYHEGMFNDVKPGDWYHENVSSVYEINLMIGRENDVFDAEDNMTVAEAFTIAARLNSIYYTGKADFIQGELWYEVYTNYCKENKIADPSKYDLEKAVTRGEFAEIFSKALPEEVLEEINKIKDGSIPDVKMNDAFSAAIYMLYRVGILTGIDENGTFGSENNIKRMEVAAITTRMAKPSLRKTVELKDPEEEQKQEEEKKEETKKKKRRSSGPSEELIPNGTLVAGGLFLFEDGQVKGFYAGPNDKYMPEIDSATLVYNAKPGYYFDGEYFGSPISNGEVRNVTVERYKVTVTYGPVRTLITPIPVPTLTAVADDKYQVGYSSITGVGTIVTDPDTAIVAPTTGYFWTTYPANDTYKFTDETVIEEDSDKDCVAVLSGTKKYALKVGMKKIENENSTLKVKYDLKEIKEVDNTAVPGLSVLFETTSTDFDGHMPEHVTVESVIPTDGGTTGTYDSGDKVVVKFKADDYYIFNKTTDHYKDTFTSTSDLIVKNAVVDETQKYLTVTFEKGDDRIFIEKIPAPTITAKYIDEGFFELDFGSIPGIEMIVEEYCQPDSEKRIWESWGQIQNLYFCAADGYYVNDETIVEEVTIPFKNYDESKTYTLIVSAKEEYENQLIVTYMLDPTGGYISGACLPLDEWYIDSNQEEFIIPRHTTLVSYTPNEFGQTISVVIKADTGYEFNPEEGFYNGLYDVSAGGQFMIKSYMLTDSNRRMSFTLSENGH